MRYACDILIQYSEKDFLSFFQNAIKTIGFKPMYFDVFFDEFKKAKNDLDYDEEYILELLNKKSKPGSITIKSDVYSEDNPSYNWFGITLSIDDEDIESIGKSCLFEWSVNGNLDFLRSSELFNRFIQSEKLVYCYLYNQTDATEQSNMNYIKYDDSPVEKNIKIKLNKVGDKIIDTSQHWGRIERVRSINFVAAANMWFGYGYNPVFNLEKMRKFKYVKTNVGTINDVVYIELFSLYDDPSAKENRAKQKEYWDFLKSNKIIINYEKNNKIEGGIEWYIRRAKRKSALSGYKSNVV